MLSRTRPVAGLLVALAMSLAASPAALADDGAASTRAQALFDEAIALMKAGKYAEACPRLEESDRLDPGMGTEYRLAECHESAGKIASAWTVFRAVADAATRAGQGDRAALSIRRAAALAPRLPTLLIDVPASALLPDLSLRIDGNPIARADWGRKIPVDPGLHLIAARAPRHVGWVRSITPVEASSTTVTVPLLGDGSAPPPPPPPPPPPRVEALPTATPGLSAPRIAALAVGGVGVAGVVVGAVFGLRAGSQWTSATATCADPVKGQSCTPAGIELGKQASGSATLSTVGFITGGAALLTGTVLWIRFAPPRPLAAASSLALAPTFGPGGGGARLDGSF
jgi:hypothetical protein